MSVYAGPQPGVGQQERVVVAGYPLHVVPGSYKRSPATRFGEKISTGDLRYADFNPYESAASYSQFTQGFGLRRFSDLPEGVNPEGYYAESINVDGRAPGVCISPALNIVNVDTSQLASVGNTGLFFGEWAPSAGAITTTQWVFVSRTRVSLVAGSSVFYFSDKNTLVSTGYRMCTHALATAIGGNNIIVAGPNLIVGAGTLTVAQYITDLDGSNGQANITDTSSNALYVLASAVDRSAVYIAGGASTSNTSQVLSASLTATTPATSFATQASAIQCGNPNYPITALAPGGGVAGVILFVCKTNEFGYIDTSAVYHTIMPFEQSLSTNGVGMKWWLTGSDPTAVGSVLVFPMGHSLWAYTTGGQPVNLSPEGKQGFRPINARGVVTAIQPSTHYLYYAIQPSPQAPSQASQAEQFIIANDGVTGANHTYRTSVQAFGDSSHIQAMGVTSLFGNNPLFYFGRVGTGNGDGAAYIILPADGDYPPADANCTYDTSSTGNTLLLPDIDFGFPDEDKIAFYLRLSTDSLVPGAQYITAAYALDGAATYTNLGTFIVSPIQDIPFPTTLPTWKRMSIQLTFVTTNTTLTPILNAVSLRASINPKQYWTWDFEATVPAGPNMAMADTSYNAHTVLEALGADYKAGTSVPYTDRWQKQWQVRIMQIGEQGQGQTALHPPDTTLSMSLLELYPTGLESAWDAVNTRWDDPNTTWGN